jgi:competence protein ComFC
MSFFSTVMDLLFPPKCPFCHHVLRDSRQLLCSSCEQSLPYTKNDCTQEGDYFSICVSPLYYEGVVRESFHRFKFKSATGYAGAYGKLIANCIRENLMGQYDLISWVPLSAQRLKHRGYDQSMLLAMSTALELEDVAVETLIKHTDVPAQSGLGGEEHRRANIAGVYKASDPDLVAGKRILLIDDIITTGSTLSESAKTLKLAGAEQILCATLARGQG